MKILHVFHNSDLVNGVDQTTLTLLRALQSMGHSVSALVPQEGDVTAALAKLGVDYRTSALGCCTGPAKMAEFAYLSRVATRSEEIEEWLKSERFDLVHVNTGHLLDAAVAAARAGVPAVWHIHAPYEVDLQRYAGFMAPEGYAWLLGTLGSHVIAVSDDVRTSLLPHLPAQKVSTLHNGIDVEDLEQRAGVGGTSSIREELGLAPETRLVIGVGRISAQKDFATFVRVASRVAAVHPGACFAIVGPAEERSLAAALEEQITELQLSNRVFLLGPRLDVPRLLAQSDVFLSTAIFEGQGLAALEALALRVPVVAMDCVGLRECLRHGTDSLVVPLGDEEACAAAVGQLISDPVLSGTLGAQGREAVAARYSAAAYAQGFLTIVDRVVAQYEPGLNAGAASFALGLLHELREAHARLTQQSHSNTSIVHRLLSRALGRSSGHRN